MLDKINRKLLPVSDQVLHLYSTLGYTEASSAKKNPSKERVNHSNIITPNKIHFVPSKSNIKVPRFPHNEQFLSPEAQLPYPEKANRHHKDFVITKKFRGHSEQLKKNSQPFKDTFSTNLCSSPLTKMTASLTRVDHKIVKNCLKGFKRVNASCFPQEIYQFFIHVYQQCAIQLQLPLIKKYKNCIYFGQSFESPSQTYEGLLLFYDQKIYYGEFVNENKHGKGVEISFKEDLTYEGHYEKGHKVGRFKVYRKGSVYDGELSKGKYHGQGTLVTANSTYKGEFKQGCRHGQGHEYFHTSGLRLSGIFHQDQFENTKNFTNTNNRYESTRKISHKKLPMKALQLPQQLIESYGNVTCQSFSYSFDSGVEEESEISTQRNQGQQKQKLQLDSKMKADREMEAKMGGGFRKWAKNGRNDYLKEEEPLISRHQGVPY